jgi:hypothetical protein
MSAAGLVDQTIQALTAQTATFEALLLFASALHKVVKRAHFKTVVREFAGVPAALAPAALAAAAAIEATAAILMFSVALRAVGAALATLVWAVYLVLLVRAFVQGRRDADCGCGFGPAHRLGAYQVARNMALLGLSALVLLDSITTGSIEVQSSQILAGCALLALYGALDQVMALAPLRRGELL